MKSRLGWKRLGACRASWWGHMPTRSAPVFENGIIMAETMHCMPLVILNHLADPRILINPDALWRRARNP
jgi:hypothetical protein